MGSNFRHIRQLTMKVAALEHLLESKIDVSTFSRLLMIQSFLKLVATCTCIKSCMSSNFGQTEYAARLKKSMSPFFCLLLIRSFLNLQVTKTYIKSRISSNFSQIRPLSTAESVALECLKNIASYVSMLTCSVLIESSLKLLVTRSCNKP